MAAYDDLLDRYRRISNIGNAAGLLNWDQQVMMPDGGTPARSQQLAALSTTRHELLVSDETADLLDAAEAAGLEPAEQAVVREIRREYERETDVPSDLVDELTRTQSDAQETWQDAKAESDFESFAPTLRDLRDLHRDRAGYIDDAKSPYAVLFEDGEPYLPLSRVEQVFEELKAELPDLIEAIRESESEVAWPFEGSYDEDAQLALCRDALDFLGYDWDRGRLDTAPHPFMSGNQFDARITTRFKEGEPLDALTAAVHEFGHATYQLGLRDDAYATPLGEPRSSGVHESQSRFWENHVGRTRAFWEAFLPKFTDRFPQHADATVEDLYQAVNKVRPDNRIRVEADEITYHLHIILRCEIDRAFVEGDLAADEIPATWNEKMDQYLGVRPRNDAEGCLQDIHWSYGFAGFQNYTVGSVLAAQLEAAMEEDIGDLDAHIRRGEFEPMHEWLTENVHEHGCRYTTDELIEEATGEPLTAEYYLDHVREKFGELYDL
ncbi:carboxypeptidase M32 [Haloarchaeobius amylolyticus]|uniref:carboxypeptidase M32 n=1 Tax=Haloarchaeobius amylolyticus TaxID=1198296 RepID=UPI00226EDC95|nr:carboxypeptidase M32 [Haloarchaeobius amylolyticus]